MCLDVSQILRQRRNAPRKDKGACSFERVALVVRPIPAKMGQRVHVERPVEELFGILTFRERFENADCGGLSFAFSHVHSRAVVLDISAGVLSALLMLITIV